MSNPAPPSAYVLEQSVSLWQQLQDSLTTDQSFERDEYVVSPLLLPDGDTVPHPHKLLEQAIDAAIWCDRRAEESENLKKRYLARQQRYEARGVAIRATIAQLMEVLGVTACEAELGAVSMVKEKVVVIADVDWLPEQYIRTKTTREPDKIALAKDLKDGKDIPGAELSNPGMVPRITAF